MLPKPPPQYSLMITTSALRNADPAGDRRDGSRQALRRAVQIQFAVLPVRHRRARFERLMDRVLLIRNVFDDEVRFLEAGVDIAPHRGFASLRISGPLTGSELIEVCLRPLDRLDLAAHEHVAFGSSIRAARLEAIERIDHERQRFEVDSNRFDGGGRQFFAVRGDRENRLAFVERLFRQAELRWNGRRLRLLLRGRNGGGGGRRSRGAGCTGARWRRGRSTSRCIPAGRSVAAPPAAAARWCTLSWRGGWWRQIVRGQNRVHTWHRQRATRIDVDDSRVRPRTEHQLGEQHAVGAEVFGVLGLAGDLRDQIGRLVVVTDQFELARVNGWKRRFRPGCRLCRGCLTCRGCGRCAGCARCGRCGALRCLVCHHALLASSAAFIMQSRILL